MSRGVVFENRLRKTVAFVLPLRLIRRSIPLIVVCVVLLGCGRPFSAVAAGVNVSQNGTDYRYYNLNAFISYLEDVDGHETIESIRRRTDWVKNTSGRVLNFGFLKHPVWVSFPIDFDLNANQSWHLVIPYPLLQNAEVYLVSKKNVILWHESLPIASSDSRTLFSYQINYALPDIVNSGSRIYLKVSSSTSLQVPLEIWDRDYLIIQQSIETLLWGLYFGLMLALMLYNNFLFISLRDNTYLYYVFALLSIVVLMLAISGFGNRYLWRDAQVTAAILPISAFMVSFWLICFCISFLKPENINHWIIKFLKFLAGLCILLSIYVLFSPEIGAVASGWVGLLTVILVLFAGTVAWLNQRVVARYFVLATATFGLGSLLYLANVFGVLPSSQITNHAIQVGSVLEALMFSFALAHRFKEERRHKLNAVKQMEMTQRALVRIQNDALQQALHDPVSRKPNEYLLGKRVDELIADVNNTNSFALVLMNFPQIKQIASSMGRELSEDVFESLIFSLERKLEKLGKAFLIEPTTKSYVSVQEFGCIVFLCRTNDGVQSINEFVSALVRTYDSALKVGEISIRLDVYCGVAVYPKHGDRADLLLQYACAARDCGLRTSERLTIYSAEISAFGRRRLELVGALSQAVKNKELKLYLQPQFDCVTQQMTGAEVLLRWSSDQFGVVRPVEFIEVAEEAGMMSGITRYLIDESFSMLSDLYAIKLSISLSINLSTQNLMESNFVTFVLNKAEEYKINLSDIVFEVTETYRSEDIKKVINTLEQLGSVGCRISLDDYGTGYSSLMYLSQLPINELKIDRSFVSRTDCSMSDYRIVENTLKLAKALQIETVAEGVETQQTLKSLVMLGCNRVQGFYFAKPMPIFQFREWLGRKAS